jgi:hypothetical protein
MSKIGEAFESECGCGSFDYIEDRRFGWRLVSAVVGLAEYMPSYVSSLRIKLHRLALPGHYNKMIEREWEQVERCLVESGGADSDSQTK